MRRLACAAALALIAAFAAGALEIKEGLVKLVINENSARVSLYRLIDVAKGRYEPLIFDQDPRTTYVTLSIDGKQVKLGDASDYRFTVSRIDTGALLEFRSSFCAVRQKLEFAKSEGSALADGIKVTFELENVSERDELLGLRFLVDTWLGEKSGAHFSTDLREKVGEETEIPATAADRWIVSPGERASFMVEIQGPGLVRPDRAVLANWKRITDSTWLFDVNPQRNFTLVPYSINDSAIALYWEPVLVPRGGLRSISFIAGSFNDKGYSRAKTATTGTEELFKTTVLGSAAPDAKTAAAGDLLIVRDLISRIDRALSSGAAVSFEEIEAWKKILDKLEERKKGY
jgi:hypothetical protein